MKKSKLSVREEELIDLVLTEEKIVKYIPYFKQCMRNLLVKYKKSINESSGEALTLADNEDAKKHCHASYCRDRKLCSDNDILRKTCVDWY